MATQDGRVRKNGKTSVVTDENDHKDDKQSVETNESDVSVTSMTNGQMSSKGDQHVQECTHAPERDFPTDVHTADVSLPENPLRWFASYMSVSQSNLQAMSQNLQVMSNDVQAIDKLLQGVQGVVDQRFMALQQIMPVQQKVDDNAEIIMGVTTVFSKFNDTLTTVQSKLDTLQNYYDEKMSTTAEDYSDRKCQDYIYIK